MLLDFRDKPIGHGITVDDLKAALAVIDYTIKPLDIPLIWSGAGAYNGEDRYVTDHCGMTGEATHWLLDQGVKVTGIDAITYDRPVKTMFELKEFWPAHRVMLEREYYHLENMMNFEKLPLQPGSSSLSSR